MSLSLPVFLRREKKVAKMKCEWCGKNYPEKLKSGEVFYRLYLYGTEIHTICDDCYSHLKKVESK